MKTLSRCMICAGLCLLLCTAVLAVGCIREAGDAARCASEALTVLTSAEPAEAAGNDTAGTEPKGDLPERVVDGVSYVGILEIPKLGLRLPVTGRWSEENAKRAPCRYSGSPYTEDLILCGHNYESHFGQLNRLSVGDPVYFTDLDDNRFSYHVAKTAILSGTSVEEMMNGDWDLTLFTCTSGGKARFTLRCEAEE